MHEGELAPWIYRQEIFGAAFQTQSQCLTLAWAWSKIVKITVCTMNAHTNLVSPLTHHIVMFGQDHVDSDVDTLDIPLMLLLQSAIWYGLPGVHQCMDQAIMSLKVKVILWCLVHLNPTENEDKTVHPLLELEQKKFLTKHHYVRSKESVEGALWSCV